MTATWLGDEVPRWNSPPRWPVASPTRGMLAVRHIRWMRRALDCTTPSPTGQHCLYIRRFIMFGVPTGIRTPVAAVRGRCPRPLDDGDEAGERTIRSK